MADIENHIDDIANEETLYRRIPADLGYKRLPDGKFRISSTAFSDRLRRPSVDRALLRQNDPLPMLRLATDGVASLSAAQVRSVRIPSGESTINLVEYVLDVEPVPLEDNPAHAEIFALPFPEKDRTFEKIRSSLAQLARWVVEPRVA